MAFDDISFENTLPPYLSQPNKTRLKEGLSQFFSVGHRIKDKRYDHFYLDNPPDFFMQGDVINSIPVYNWDAETNQYITGYSPVVMISSTCDIFEDHDRLLEKEVLFATLIPLIDFCQDLEAEGFTEKNIKSIHSNLRQQLYSNLFYLPPNPIDGREFVVFFDKTFWHPSIKFLEKRERINEERFISLDHFGFYLFICKLSYHFCRVPEDCHRSE
jgi:hypothetical protein